MAVPRPSSKKSGPNAGTKSTGLRLSRLAELLSLAWEARLKPSTSQVSKGEDNFGNSSNEFAIKWREEWQLRAKGLAFSKTQFRVKKG
jgi:hypothetical protein